MDTYRLGFINGSSVLASIFRMNTLYAQCIGLAGLQSYRNMFRQPGTFIANRLYATFTAAYEIWLTSLK